MNMKINNGEMQLFCCGCDKEVRARLTDGAEIYPHREDLSGIPFWKCDNCQNHVGCHHKSKDPSEPLGAIPTKEIRRVRKRIHEILDPIWRNYKRKKFWRTKIYKQISDELGYQYHTGNIRTIEEAIKVYLIIKRLETHGVKQCLTAKK